MAMTTQPKSDDTRSAAQLARRIVQKWNDVADGRSALALLTAVWFAVAVPPAFLRGYHYVEGLTVTIAESALLNGDWLTPHLYNFRWVERPTLLSWVIAGISLPLGHIEPIVARLPTILSLVAGCWLIWRTLRPRASAGAALLGGLTFLACPIVMRYYSTAVADIPLAVLLFGTFLLWWTSFETGEIRWRRWAFIGAMMAAAGLLKGPQPVAYFLLGIGAFIVLTRTWWQLPGLALAAIVSMVPVALWYMHVFIPGDQGEWLRYTRLSSTQAESPHPLDNAVRFFAQAFPAAILATSLLLPQTTKQTTETDESDASHLFVMALACYTLTCTVALLFWPASVNPRYMLPMVPPACVLGGLAYDRLARRSAVLAASSLCIVAGMLAYGSFHALVGEELWPQLYRQTKVSGAQIAELVRQTPAPIYRTTWNAGLNELPYVPYPVTTIDLAAVSTISAPAWIVVPSWELDSVISESHGRLKPALVLERSVLLRLE